MENQLNSKRQKVIFQLTRSTHFLPFNSGKDFDKTAANPAAPAPSTTAFSTSSSRKIADAMKSSDIVTTLSMSSLAVSNEL